MAMKFMGKNIRKKVVIPIRSSVMYPQKAKETETKEVEAKEEETVEQVMSSTAPKSDKKNKKAKKGEKMNVNTLSEIENLASATPEKNVKIEKKEKGLYERMENTVLLTEDNKMLLND